MCQWPEHGIRVSGEALQGNDAIRMRTDSELLQVAFISRIAFSIDGGKKGLLCTWIKL